VNQESFEEKMKEIEDDAYDARMAAITLPKRGVCVVDDKIAIMDRVYFDELCEYSCSTPTGAFIGKRWKHNNNAYPPVRCPNCQRQIGCFYFGTPCPCGSGFFSEIVRGLPEEWFMCEFIKTDDPKRLQIKAREIIVL
jgi:hypothetical protein